MLELFRFKAAPLPGSIFLATITCGVVDTGDPQTVPGGGSPHPEEDDTAGAGAANGGGGSEDAADDDDADADDDDDDDDDDGGGGGGAEQDWPSWDGSGDHVAPSVDPPGGIAVADAPMFVAFGFDDNAYADSIEWFADLVRMKKNADGSPVRGTFFLTAGYADEKLVTDGGQTAQDVLDAWRMLFDDGHEIANHTFSHAHGRTEDTAWWSDEITRARTLFVDDLGVPQSRLWGFRTPFLEYNTSTFEALRGLGMRYDCSIEFGYNWWQHDPEDWTTGHGPGEADSGEWYAWPYTLDNGSAEGSSDGGAGANPGMWEIPVYTYNQLRGESVSTITGFDFNMWLTLPSDVEFLDVMKFSFDQRYRGNRSPFTVNAHTDYYSQYNEWDDPEFGCKDYLKRREALEKFLDYVLSFDEVRVVPFIRVIDWMRDPVPWQEM
ncbi:MAG: polysaccharide deacetylase family protein [Nannocystaceae bacterium]